MKIMHCPLNGPRNIAEFVCGGEVLAIPDPVSGTDREWAAYTFIERNHCGVVHEWWLHAPTSYWFIAERDTATDEIIRTYAAAQLFNTRRDFADKGQP